MCVDTQDQNRMTPLDIVEFEQANKYSSYLGNQERHQKKTSDIIQILRGALNASELSLDTAMYPSFT